MARTTARAASGPTSTGCGSTTVTRCRYPAGVDPQGWTAGLRHFVDDRYRLVASKTFDDALRSAVTNLRRTNLPVAVAVSHGNHGWVLTGFTATADPRRTSSFKITSVRVVGPLFGLQSKNGYDMPPNTKLTPAQFRRFFTPWRYAPMRMIWDGPYVSIQPIRGEGGGANAEARGGEAHGDPQPDARPQPIAELGTRAQPIPRADIDGPVIGHLAESDRGGACPESGAGPPRHHRWRPCGHHSRCTDRPADGHARRHRCAGRLASPARSRRSRR